MTRDGSRTGRADTLAATTCAGLVVSMWLLLPTLVRAAEPAAADGLPATGDLAWWAVLILLVSQSAVLAWRRARPEVAAIWWGCWPPAARCS